MQGSTRVNVRAEKFLKERLKNSAYGNEEDIKTMLDYFDKFTKPVFKDSNETSYIKFGSMGCNDPKAKIRRGQLQLSGAEMASFFRPALDSIVATVQRQRQAAESHPIKNVFLVGGFAASPWLYNGLQTTLQARGMTLCRPDTHTSKAVSEGAVSFYLDRFVSARVIRTTYGVACNHDYEPNDPEHAARALWKFVRPSGRVVLPNGFSPILTKGTRVREHQEISSSFCREAQARQKKKLNNISTSITCYKGRLSDPQWMDVESEMFTPLCTIHADTSKVARTPRAGSQGNYYVQAFNVVLQCGLTEMKAQISWTEDGQEKRGPATIVYDDELEEYH
ncbi:hypothetical protein K466DRAFT_532982 [Polyporus arcularius HHB13444]|uniref:Actin-like ATPase domain-containing protein n=1 Tax=Polyporus arcularius HHB13444 TaxID=1314778 RepID=A0A5C3P3S6_9APHY|nr:hypothetical protein K466DRAFT_532982 [Polyporus arcularius HHB13444]